MKFNAKKRPKLCSSFLGTRVDNRKYSNRDVRDIFAANVLKHEKTTNKRLLETSFVDPTGLRQAPAELRLSKVSISKAYKI